MAFAGTDDHRSLNIMKSSRLSSLSEPCHDEVDIFRDSNRVEEVVSAKNVLREFIGLQSELAVKKLYANSVDFRSAFLNVLANILELHSPHGIRTSDVHRRQEESMKSKGTYL